MTAATSSFRVADENSPTPLSTDKNPPTAPPASATVGDLDTPSAPSPIAEKKSPVTSVPATETPQSQSAPVDSPVPAPPVTPPIDTGSAPAANAYKVPEGEEAIVAFLNEAQQRFLQEMQRPYPPGAIPAEVLDECRRIQQARLEASEKLLALAKDAKARFAATQSKLDALRWLVRLGDRQAEKDLHAYCRTLMKGEDKDLTLLGRMMLFGQAVDALADGRMQDVQSFVAELNSLIAESPKEQGVFVVLSQAAVVLQATGHEKEATEAFRAIGNAYKGHATPQVASQANLMLLQVKQIDLGLPNKIRDLFAGKSDSGQPLLAALTALFQGETPNQNLLSLGAEVGHMLESCNYYQEAVQAFTLVENAFKNHPDKDLAEQAVQRAQKGRLRAALVGQPFAVEGVTVDGAPFDWSAYKGKIVLVDFWATWCEPCLKEVPNIARVYQAYREKGFEVVGVNLDDELETVQRFFAVQSLPWPTVVSSDPNARGFQHPVAVKCGVDGIPFLVLVDREGKVAALHVRGPKLEEKLAQMLGSPTPETSAPETSPPPPELVPPANPAAAKPAPSTESRARPAGQIRFVSFEQAAADQVKADEPPPTNPYAPDAALSPAGLVDFIQTMQDKPQSIQARPGFAEAVIEAADRILAAETPDKHRLIAAQAKFGCLHRKACLGDASADKDLMQFVEQMKDSQDPQIAGEIKFLRLERKVLDADKLPLDQIPALLSEVKDYVAAADLTARHLRLASAAVHAINRLEKEDERDKYFQEFGGLFAKSTCKELARYGRKLTEKEDQTAEST